MSENTALWAWFLFASGLPASRAKALLERWQTQGVPLHAALQRLPHDATALGVAEDEAVRLRPPQNLPAVAALRWDEPLYPTGWQVLPLRQRPALLFYQGDVTLLGRPRLYFPPATLPEAAQELAQESLSLALGEVFVPLALRGSTQGDLLLEELQDAEGEAVLLAPQGLVTLVPTSSETRLLEAGRLLLITPLPPQAQPNPDWHALLEQLCGALASHWLLTAASVDADSVPTGVSVAWVTPDDAPAPAGIHTLDSPADVPFWLAEAFSAAQVYPQPESPPEPVYTHEPPLAPDEALRILQKAGRIPEALRRRLEDS